MTIPIRPPAGGAGNSGASETTFTPVQHTALRVLGFVLVYAALVPPITVILWRLATSDWGR